MASYHILMLGKGNYTKSEKEMTYKSSCYFDWFSFVSPIVGERRHSNSQSISEFINGNIYSKMQDKRITAHNSESYRLLQNILLMTDDDDDLLSRLMTKSEELHPLVFVSFVYTDISSDIKVKISEQIIVDVFNTVVENGSQNIGVYSTFDHCEYIVVCDGSKIQLKQYVNFLMLLKKQEGIRDVLSIYGYNSEAENWLQEKTFALVKYEDGLNIESGEELKKYATLGRFDYFTIYNDVDTHTLFDTLEKSIDSDIRYKKVFIGIENLELFFDDHGDSNNSFDNRFEKLSDKIREKYDDCITAYKNSCAIGMKKDYNFIRGIVEIKNMLISTLNRGISKYYALCMLESFFSLLCFIKEKILLNDNYDYKYNCQPENVFFRKQEEIVDLMNSYFYYIQTLSSSMLHNERKFTNADPYQLSCFDIPPRLIAFYTAISYKIIKLLKTQETCDYTVMLVPDFKQDIYVDSLTRNRDYEKERNLIIIHINERASYDILDTIKVIAHEIAHHVGQSADSRRRRTELYVKCCIATLLKEIYNEMCCVSNGYQCDLWMITMGAESYSNFSKLVDCIYDEFDFELEFKINDIYAKESWYYSASVTQHFVDYCKNKIEKSKLKQVFKDFLINNCWYNEKGYLEFRTEESPFLNMLNNTPNTPFFRDLITNLIAEEFGGCFCSCRFSNIDQQGDYTSYPFFKNLLYLFSEGMADVQMLSLIRSEYIHEKYTKEMSNISSDGAYVFSNEAIDIVRKSTVLNVFSNAVEDKSLEFDDSSIEKTSQKYICKKAIEYFNIVKSDKSIVEVVDIIEKTVLVKDLVREIDNVINQYLDELAI